MSVPVAWETRSLRSLARINYGKSPAAILADDGIYPVFGTAGPERLGSSYLYDGDSVILGRKGTIERVHYATGKFWTIDTAYYLSDFRDALPRWLFFLLQTVNLGHLNEATGVPSLSRETLYRLTVSTPPPPEQAKVAEVLFAADRAIEGAEALILKRQRIMAGLVHDLLTRGIDEHGELRSHHSHAFDSADVGAIPSTWRCGPLATFVPSAEYGISTSLGEAGEPVLRMNNLVNGEADISDLKFTNAPVPAKLWLRHGDVLFNRTNSWEHVGRTGIWRGQCERATFASYLVRLNPNPRLLLSELLNIWLNWPVTQIGMRRFATPAVQQVNINPTNLRMLPAAFPRSLDEQAEIIRRVATQRDDLSALRVTRNKLLSVKAGLMQDLLTGRKRVTALLQPAGPALEQAL